MWMKGHLRLSIASLSMFNIKKKIKPGLKTVFIPNMSKNWLPITNLYQIISRITQKLQRKVDGSPKIKAQLENVAFFFINKYYRLAYYVSKIIFWVLFFFIQLNWLVQATAS